LFYCSLRGLLHAGGMGLVHVALGVCVLLVVPGVVASAESTQDTPQGGVVANLLTDLQTNPCDLGGLKEICDQLPCPVLRFSLIGGGPTVPAKDDGLRERERYVYVTWGIDPQVIGLSPGVTVGFYETGNGDPCHVGS
jgi:hypothetical protein